MVRTTFFNKSHFVFLIITGLFLSLIWLINSPLYSNNTVLNIGITADLLFTVPIIYFLLIRKRKIPKTTVVPIILVGVIIGTYVLPKENQTYLDLFKTWGLPLIELSVVTFVIFKVRKAIKQFNRNKNGSLDFYATLKTTCAEILPKKAIMPVATEIAVFYYGFVNWTKKPLNSSEFSYHKKNSTQTLLIAFILIVAIETVTLHTLIGKWSITFAWVLTFLSIYSGFQLFGIARSLPQRPISITMNTLVLRYGILNETEIVFNNIEKIELSKKELEKNKSVKKLSPFGELEEHNIIITLKEHNTLIGLYGIKRTYNKIAFFVDEPNQFIDRLEAAIKTNI
ncbi:hypothetical protein [Seonamhaeicola marinus]|uniref:Beta-carotene 15,15'-monooxygenase n=1 Tax=Seonamhaeicola marinus TaxID=1912246 RepID=A0A5D0JK02_9FLAO|nr:hypothetical protein [Seonamhaeicola marinus]TYA94777.1 hypothetical protein FUA24_00890 [Seonamhaeicola marinus]